MVALFGILMILSLVILFIIVTIGIIRSENPKHDFSGDLDKEREFQKGSVYGIFIDFVNLFIDKNKK